MQSLPYRTFAYTIHISNKTFIDRPQTCMYCSKTSMNYKEDAHYN